MQFAGRGAEDIYLQLEELQAIGRHIEAMNQHHVRYPDPMMQNMHCHIRALWNLFQEAADQALQQRIRHTEVCRIKQLLEDTKLRRQGHIFWPRKNQPTKCHWVCLTPNLYIDNVHCMRTKDYNLASAVLRCLERPEKELGKEYSTTTTRVQKEDFIQLATYLEQSSLNNCADECKITNGDDCISNDATAVPMRGDVSKKSAKYLRL